MGGSSLELHKKRAPVSLDGERCWPGWVICPRNQGKRGRQVGNIAGISSEPRKICLKALWELSRKRNNIRVVWDWETESKYQGRTQCKEHGAKGRKRNSPSCIQVYFWWRRYNFPSVGLSFFSINEVIGLSTTLSPQQFWTSVHKIDPENTWAHLWKATTIQTPGCTGGRRQRASTPMRERAGALGSDPGRGWRIWIPLCSSARN